MITRALLFLLVVLNLGVALWWMTRADAAPAARDDAPATGVARLQLASEAGVAAETPVQAPAQVPDDAGVAVDSAAPVQPAASERCIALGPFADAAAAQVAQRDLPAAVIRSRLRTAAPSNNNWRVALPAQQDRAAAEALAARIRQAGFDDLYVVLEGAGANSIALGLFSSEAAARTHAAALRTAGFEASAARVGGDATHWLDVAFADGIAAGPIQRAVGAGSAVRLDCSRMR